MRGSYRLAARMLLALSLLVALTLTLVGTVVFACAQVGEVLASALFAPTSWGQSVGAVVGGLLAAGILLAEIRRGETIVPDTLDAVALSETTASTGPLAGLVQQTALQFDVPAPTIAVAETPVPHASVSGLTRRRTTLVVSTGLLERLSRDELAAVVAHELAHVANRDSLVVSLLALPTVLGRTVLDTLGPDEGNVGVPGGLTTNLFGIAAFVVAGSVWLVGRSLLALFARQRELAADRAGGHLVGSPGDLAAALSKLDAEAVETPTADLRQVAAVSAFSIVEPPGSSAGEEFTIWTDGRAPVTIRARDSLVAVGERLFATHPSTEERRETLQSVY